MAVLIKDRKADRLIRALAERTGQTVTEVVTTVAGAPGFEPGNGGTKNRCLTAWRRPTGAVGAYIIGGFGAGNRKPGC